MTKEVRAASIERKLLELLVCPLSKSILTFDAERCELVSKAAKLAFPIRDGIPIMLPSEARVVDDDSPDAERKSVPPKGGLGSAPR